MSGSHVCRHGRRDDGYTARQAHTHAHKITYTYLPTVVYVIVCADVHKVAHAKLIAHARDPVHRLMSIL